MLLLTWNTIVIVNKHRTAHYFYSTFFIHGCVLCLEKNCGIPVNGTNTKAVPQQSLVFEESYTYECITGYVTSQGTSTTCGADGMFTIVNPPTCNSK